MSFIVLVPLSIILNYLFALFGSILAYGIGAIGISLWQTDPYGIWFFLIVSTFAIVLLQKIIYIRESHSDETDTGFAVLVLRIVLYAICLVPYLYIVGLGIVYLVYTYNVVALLGLLALLGIYFFYDLSKPVLKIVWGRKKDESN